MTRHQPMRAAADPALALAGAHAVALLSGRESEPLELQLAGLAEAAASPLSGLVRRFGLGPLDLDLFVIVAAPELGVKAATALSAHPLALDGRATPALCRAILGPAAAPALAATGLLRQGLLVDMLPGAGFAERRLAVPEAVAAALAGAPGPDPLLAGALSSCASLAAHGGSRPETALLAAALLRTGESDPPPILHLATDDPWLAASVAAAAAGRVGLGLVALEPALLPPGVDPARAARLLNRDVVLTGAAVLVPASADGCLIADRLRAPAVLWGLAPVRTLRPLATLAPARGAGAGETAARDARASHGAGFAASLPMLLQRQQAKGLEGLAERIEPQAAWSDLVLPEAQLAQLRQLAASRRHSGRVLGDWGFRGKSARGLALTALFSGPSGSGKTMAAEILARELCEDDLCKDGGALALYRVDLAALISKYIGETQKNIGRIFDAAEAAGAVLLFDEGEAIFARRSSEVKDSHDRHANSETSYLLQRLESYGGIAIVTTNLRAAVDDAFLRRFRAVVDFPFPDAGQRARIWKSVLPDGLPRENIDFEALSRLAVTGGFIRSIALTAAFLAAESDGPLTMRHLERAARQEYGKLGKPLAEAELRGFR